MSTRDGKYSYSVGICTDPVHDESSSDSAGVIQVDSGTNKRKSLGSFKNAKAIAGSRFITFFLGSTSSKNINVGLQIKYSY